MVMANEIEKLLTQFNIDPQNRKIRDYYEEDNLWRTLKIERDENSHSAFIAWLLGTETTRENSPILNFLNLIVRCKNDKVVVDRGYNNLKTAILLGTIKFLSVDITAEKVVSKISKIRYNDRLDIYINCAISGVKEYTNLEIIIENKIDSSEGGKKLNELKNPTTEEKKYKEMSQTKRYYFACSKEKELRQDKLSDTLLQLFVFLTPQEETPKDEHFIKITYQDVVDYIIQPLLNREDLNPHTAFVLKEYLRTLGNPYNNKITMATTKEERELLKEFYTRNEDLFRRALEVMKNDATDEDDRSDFNSMLESMKDRKSRRRAFSINGKGEYKMYQVVAEFTKYLLEQKNNINVIEGLLKKYTNEKSRCHISDDKTKVFRYMYKDREHFHTDSYNNKEFYVTKEWGYDSKGDSNFAGFLKQVNKNYSDFHIDEITQ